MQSFICLSHIEANARVCVYKYQQLLLFVGIMQWDYLKMNRKQFNIYADRNLYINDCT